jgi:mannose-6-phosphate isomerase-like protein (cupin superfamily)
MANIGETECEIADGDVSIMPSGTFHNFRNTGLGMLKLSTTYSPPELAPGIEHATKSEADVDG